MAYSNQIEEICHAISYKVRNLFLSLRSTAEAVFLFHWAQWLQSQV